MNTAEFRVLKEELPGCGQPAPGTGWDAEVICESHVSDLHSHYNEETNVLLQWGDE